jgi:benzoate/toluate 1,2-dioxygenase subunit alpha
LGDVRVLLDLVADQGPDGIEMIPGMSSYTYRGNWKWQIENCVDAYHLTSAHPSFMNVVTRRKMGESKNKQVKSIDFNLAMKIQGGSYTFPRGHAIIWGVNPSEFERPIYFYKDELTALHGELKTRWMMYTRNLTVFPNVQFAENASLQCRIIRPLSVDLTEMTIFCIGVKNEKPQAREMRLRQYEDFFNTSGLATPDDSIAYEDCQAGLVAPTVQWQQGYARGRTEITREPDAAALELGIRPTTTVYGTFGMQDETVFHGYLQAWKKMLQDGLAADPRG